MGDPVFQSRQSTAYHCASNDNAATLLLNVIELEKKGSYLQYIKNPYNPARKISQMKKTGKLYNQ